MIIHYIVLSSSYSEGTRIALHLPFKDRIDSKVTGDVLDRIRKGIPGTPPMIAVHIKQTDSESWESVRELDSYSIGIKVIGTVDEFIELIRRDRTFKGVDVAKYILSVTKCTHTCPETDIPLLRGLSLQNRQTVVR